MVIILMNVFDIINKTMIFKQSEIKYVEYNEVDNNVLLKNNVLIMNTSEWPFLTMVLDNGRIQMKTNEAKELKKIINRFNKHNIAFDIDENLYI